MSARPRVLCPGFADGAAGAGDARVIAGESAHHLARVLRVREGEALMLFDGAGREARARVERVQARGSTEVVVTLEEAPRDGVTADRAGVLWLQGYPKGDKLESVIRQATELGVRAIWPVYTARSVPRPRGEGGRVERLRAVAVSAATQCGRADVPEVREGVSLEAALEALPAACALRIVAWEEDEDRAALATVLAEQIPGEGCAVLVGPEGGLGRDEVALAREHGFRAVSLGPRVLRTETVAPALLAMLALARGDLAPPRT